MIISINHVHGFLSLQVVVLHLLRGLHVGSCLDLVGRVDRLLAERATSDSHVAVWIGRAPVAGSVLILRLVGGAISLISWVIALPLATLLIFDHLSQVLLHRLSQLAVGVEWCVVSTVDLGVLVVDVHASTA